MRRTSRELIPWLVLLLSLRGVAANHYIRTGAGGPIPCTAGWGKGQACSDLPTLLVRGDTYYIAAGTYDHHDFADSDSGETRITVEAATVADHGTNTGWSDAYLGQAVFRCTSACGSVLGFDTDYYTVDGVYRSTTSGDPNTDWTNESAYGFKVDASNGSASNDIAGGLGYAGSPNYVHDITIQHIDVNGAHPINDAGQHDFGLSFQGGSYNLFFRYLYVHDDYVMFFLKGNHFHQNDGGWIFGSGDNITIEYSFAEHDYTSPKYHGAMCSCSEGLTNFTFRYNYARNIVGTSFLDLASGANYTGNGQNGSWYVYGNIFYYNKPHYCGVGDGSLAVFDTTFTGPIYFLNNTIANVSGTYCGGGESGLGFGLTYRTPLNTLYVQNNLWWNSDPISIIPTGTTSWQGATFNPGVRWSYNAYFNDPKSQGNDPDSHKQVSSANPFLNSAGYNYQLSGHTKPGANTSALVPGNDTDLLGHARTTWDRGALEYQPRATLSGSH